MGRHKTAQNVGILPWLSAKADCKEGRFIQVGNTLLLSEEFQALTAGTKFLYLCMAMESGGKSNVKFTHGAARKKYGIAGTSYDHYIADLKAKGFIALVEDENMAQYAPCIYQFTFDWKVSPSKVAPQNGVGKPKNPPQNGEGKD